jgi:hypothetical protein
VGDIVLAVQELERPVIHRVVSASRDEDGDRITTRGDNCTLSDPTVPAHAVLARVVASERGGVWTSHVPSMRFGTGALLRGALLALRARLAHIRRVVRRRLEAGRSAVGVGGSGG